MYVYTFSGLFKKKLEKGKKGHLGCDSALEVDSKGKYTNFLTPVSIIKCDVYKRNFDTTDIF